MADDPAELVRRHPTLLPKFRAVRFVAGAPSRAAPQLPAALTRAALAAAAAGRAKDAREAGAAGLRAEVFR